MVSRLWVRRVVLYWVERRFCIISCVCEVSYKFRYWGGVVLCGFRFRLYLNGDVVSLSVVIVFWFVIGFRY